MAIEGMTTVESHFGPWQTLERLENEVRAKGLTLFARIDHTAGAATIGMELRPTVVLLFGNPRGGTPLMQSNQLIGYDLPLRVLVWQDAAGKSWLSYVDPTYMAKHYGLSSDTTALVNSLADVIRTVTREAAGTS